MSVLKFETKWGAEQSIFGAGKPFLEKADITVSLLSKTAVDGTIQVLEELKKHLPDAEPEVVAEVAQKETVSLVSARELADKKRHWFDFKSMSSAEELNIIAGKIEKANRIIDVFSVDICSQDGISNNALQQLEIYRYDVTTKSTSPNRVVQTISWGI